MTTPTTAQQILELVDTTTKLVSKCSPSPWDCDNYIVIDKNGVDLCTITDGPNDRMELRDPDVADFNRELIIACPVAISRRDRAIRILVEAVQARLDANTAFLRANEHLEDAVQCGYDNDPTGSLHVTDSFRRAEEKSDAAERLLSTALDRVLAELKGEG
jgi:hypothetical protein